MPKTGAKPKPAPAVTGDQIASAKKELGSWRAVANKFSLGSPNSARKLYTELTGKPHTDLNATPGARSRSASANGKRPQRASRKKVPTTLDTVSMTTTGIAEAILGRTLVVRRGESFEELEVLKVQGFHVVEKPGKAATLSVDVGDLCVTFTEGHRTKDGGIGGTAHTRCIPVKIIAEVKG